jgi:acetyl esterase/lipase
VVKKAIAEHKQIYVDASPIMRLRPDAPPFFILHGQDDSIIPVPEGREFAEAMRASSTSVVAYAEIPHAQHAFDFYSGSPRGHYTAQAVEEFLSWVHAKYAPSAEPTIKPPSAEPTIKPPSAEPTIRPSPSQ